MAKRPKMRRTLRKFVYDRDNYTCQDCGWRPASIPEDYRGAAPIAEVVGYRKKIVYARYSMTGGPDDILYRDAPVLRVLEVDHIKPLVAGGSFDDPNNLQALCSVCNNRKGVQV